jgi:hypothetical protein
MVASRSGAHLQLIEAGNHEEALALMNTEMWNVEEEKEQDGKTSYNQKKKR